MAESRTEYLDNELLEELYDAACFVDTKDRYDSYAQIDLPRALTVNEVGRIATQAFVYAETIAPTRNLVHGQVIKDKILDMIAQVSLMSGDYESVQSTIKYLKRGQGIKGKYTAWCIGRSFKKHIRSSIDKLNIEELYNSD